MSFDAEANIPGSTLATRLLGKVPECEGFKALLVSRLGMPFLPSLFFFSKYIVQPTVGHAPLGARIHSRLDLDAEPINPLPCVKVGMNS